MRSIVLVSFLVASTANAEPPPNVLLIIADDCTYLDLECYGGQARTPHLKRLCQEGMRFTQCTQAAAMCSPTRHCLLTGQYPVKTGAYPNHTFVKPGVRSIAHYLHEAGYRVALSGKRHIRPQSAFPFEYSGRGNPDFAAIDAFFSECAASRTPFCLFACSNEPHTPWNRGDPSAYPVDEIVLPPCFVDTPSTRTSFASYLAEITYFDSQVGRCLELLDKHGLRDRTLVIVVSEQGSAFPFAKWTCYEVGLGSAMVVRWPGHVAPLSTSSALVEYVDVVPTLIEASGMTPAVELDGRSFLPVLQGRAETHKEFAFGLQTSRGINDGPPHYGIRSVRSHNYRYIVNLTPEARFRNTMMRSEWWKSWVARGATGDAAAARLVERFQRRPREELFDITRDPYCLDNLADDASLQAVKATLRDRLERWMKAQGDDGQDTELDAHRRQFRNRKR